MKAGSGVGEMHRSYGWRACAAGDEPPPYGEAQCKRSLLLEVGRGLESDAAREAARRALRGVRVYALTKAAARRAAEVHHELKTRPIGERDTLIAGVCLAISRARRAR